VNRAHPKTPEPIMTPGLDAFPKTIRSERLVPEFVLKCPRYERVGLKDFCGKIHTVYKENDVARLTTEMYLSDMEPAMRPRLQPRLPRPTWGAIQTDVGRIRRQEPPPRHCSQWRGGEAIVIARREKHFVIARPKAVAIHMALRVAPTSQETEPLFGLPPRYAPRF
jgi:hypothetical protein